MKKYLIILLLLIWVIFQTQLFSYSWEKVWDTKCSEINKANRYQNLSPIIITKIDLIWDKINKKYTDKDNIYKEKIYNLFIKVLNQYLEKIQYSEVQKEVLLRIWDYFVCKKEWLINKENLDVYNVKVLNITDHSAKVTWEWNSEAQTWLYVKKTWWTWIKHNAKNNLYVYPDLWPNYEFTLYIQWVWSNKIKKLDFKTLDKEIINYIQPIDDNDWETTQNTINKYLEEVNIPKYNPNDSTHFLIDSIDKFNSKNLNNKNYKHFYIKSGDYTSVSNIILTTWGSKFDRRTLSLYTPWDDRHPGQMTKEEWAQVMIIVESGADYWIFDRLSIYGYQEYSFRIYWAKHTIINRFYAKNHGYTIIIDNGSDYTTIQNSRWDTLVTGSDAVQANIVGRWNNLTDSNWNKHYSVFHTKIIHNEFVDQNDGFQATVYAVNYGDDGPWQFGNVGGTIVNDNDFYLRENHVDRENATDTKTWSPDPKLPLDENNPTIDSIISENRFWGYKNGPNGISWEATISSMYSPGWKIYNNIYYDCDGAISGWSNYPSTGMHHGYVNSEFYGNIIYKSGLDKGNSNTDKWQSMIQHNTSNVNIHDNYFIEPNVKRLAKFWDCRENSVFMNNRVVDPFKWEWEIFERTDYWNDSIFSNSISTTYEMSRNSFTDYVFMTDKFTNNPKKIILPRILDPKWSITSPIK